MKLPHPSDPHGDKEGALPRAQVLDVLYRHGVTVTPRDEYAQLEKDDIIERHQLPEIVGGLLIRRLSRLFEIPIQEFYFPRRSDVH
ncbi:MAG: hypothetical protein ACREVY_13650 [Gammaproteobacteria bacterium]